jgi:hypothetical protein
MGDALGDITDLVETEHGSIEDYLETLNENPKEIAEALKMVLKERKE